MNENPTEPRPLPNPALPQATPRAKIHPFTFYAIGALILGGVFVVWNYLISQSGPGTGRPPFVRTISKDMEFIDHKGQKFLMSDMRGKVFIAAQVFTRCPGQCAGVAGELKEFYEKFEAHPDFQMLTFTIDPAHDGPEQLQTFRKNHGIDREKWTFLTGDDERKMRNYLREYFKYTVTEKPEDQRTMGEDDLFEHNTLVTLVDRTGKIRGDYMILTEDPKRNQEALRMLNRDLQSVLDEASTSQPRIWVMYFFGGLAIVILGVTVVGIRQRVSANKLPAEKNPLLETKA